MAAVVAAVSAADTTDDSALTTGSFTPAAGDLLVAFCGASDMASNGFISDTQSLGWTRFNSTKKNTNADVLEAFVSNQFAANSAMTVTYTPAASSTGVVISVLRISGMTRSGAVAILQNAQVANQAGGGTPAHAFGVSAQTGNPTLGAVFNTTNPSTLTEPTGWTEIHDIGYATPATGLEVVSRDSGFTGTTITWGGASASNFGVILAEMDSSAPTHPVAKITQPRYGLWGRRYGSFSGKTASGGATSVASLVGGGVGSGAFVIGA